MVGELIAGSLAATLIVRSASKGYVTGAAISLPVKAGIFSLCYVISVWLSDDEISRVSKNPALICRAFYIDSRIYLVAIAAILAPSIFLWRLFRCEKRAQDLLRKNEWPMYAKIVDGILGSILEISALLIVVRLFDLSLPVMTEINSSLDLPRSGGVLGFFVGIPDQMDGVARLRDALGGWAYVGRGAGQGCSGDKWFNGNPFTLVILDILTLFFVSLLTSISFGPLARLRRTFFDWELRDSGCLDCRSIGVYKWPRLWLFGVECDTCHGSGIANYSESYEAASMRMSRDLVDGFIVTFVICIFLYVYLGFINYLRSHAG